MVRSEQGNRRSRWMVIVLCVAAGVTVGVWHNHRAARGQDDPVTAAVRTVTLPLVSAVDSAGEWVGGQIGWLFQRRALAEENRLLRREIARLQEENARLKEAEITAQRLRRHLGFPAAPPGRRLAADVIALRPSAGNQTLLIARGSRDGVKLRSVVVAPEGLVGYVYDVAPTSAAVLLLTDSNAAVGAMVQRAESRAVGICKGDGSRMLSLTYLDTSADVRPGDTIISSGLGGAKGLFPKGLVIGTVVRVENDASGSSRRVAVRPAVNYDRLEEVYILP